MGSTYIVSSCILNNEDSCFCPYDSNSNITLFFCRVDSMEKSGSGFVTSHGSATTFIHGLTFTSTGSCYASFDVIDSLTATPHPGIVSVPFTFYKRNNEYII